MNLAPILLFVYNRPDHTLKTLNALIENDLAKESSLFIFADGPKENSTSSYLQAIEKTRKVIKEKLWCKTVKIFESEKNLGLSKSIVNGISEIINQYGQAIILEDDMVTSPHFLRYMNDGLMLFKNDKSIGSINGFTDGYLSDINFPPYYLLSGADCWGWATWKDRWVDFIFDAQIIKSKIIAQNKIREFEYGNHMQILNDQIAGRVNTWDVQWHGSNILKDRKGIFPKFSFIKNIGMDGSGTHCNIDLSSNDAIGLNTYEISLPKYLNHNKLIFSRSLEKKYKKYLSSKFKSSFTSRLKNKIKTKLILILRPIKQHFQIQYYLNKYQLKVDDKIFTHLTIEEKILLHKVIKSLNDKEIVKCAEIGSYLGASSCFIANALNNQSTLFCIDTWENDAMIYQDDDQADENLIKKSTLLQFENNTAKYRSKIKMLRGWSYDMIDELKSSTDTLNFLFIDGDHSYEGVKKDWNLYKQFLKKGSIVAFHDISWAKGVTQLIEEEVLPIAKQIHLLPNLAIYKVS